MPYTELPVGSCAILPHVHVCKETGRKKEAKPLNYSNVYNVHKNEKRQNVETTWLSSTRTAKENVVEYTFWLLEEYCRRKSLFKKSMYRGHTGKSIIEQ